MSSSAGTPVATRRGWRHLTTRTATALVVVAAVCAVLAVAASGRAGRRLPPAGTVSPYRGPVHTGGKWSLQRTAAFPRRAGAYLADVSCPTIRWCMAVGSYNAYGPPNATTPGDLHASDTVLPTAEVWDGSAWSRVAVPSASPTETDLVAVSCTSPSACTAVGDVAGASGFAPFAEAWDGASWSIEATAAAPSGSAQLADVSCVSADACTAVGGWDDPLGSPAGSGPLVETWNGSGWSQVAAPDVPGSESFEGLSFGGVSCASARFCVAVGTHGHDDGNSTANVAVIEAWNGTSWRVEHAPAPALLWSLDDVSCTGPRACTAVGTSDGPGAALHTVSETWDGRRWALRSTGTASQDVTSSVSCLSGDDCTAFFSGAEPEVWDGKDWRAQKAPATLGVDAVSCAPDGECTAVGSIADRPGDPLGPGAARRS